MKITKNGYLDYNGFNSTMVRLKLEEVKQTAPERKFQFHYGSIKMNDRQQYQYVYLGFNSTMVRLKSELKQMFVIHKEVSFHFGTIKQHN